MIQMQIIGNLGRDPERRTFDNGQFIVSFPVAVSVRRNGREEAEWVNVSASGNLGEICLQYLKKGRKVYVQGRPRAFCYRNRIEEMTAKLEIRASLVEFLSPGSIEPQQQPDHAAEQAASAFVEVDDEELPF